MAKNKTAEEKEYQDAVKYTSSIIGDMKRAIEETAEASDLRNKKIFEEISLTKKVLNSLKDEKSYEEALIKLSAQKGQVLQSNFGVNEKMKSTYLAQLDAADAIVKKELARLKIINETQRIADNLQNKFVKSLDSIGEKIKGIPIIGETLFNRFWTPFSDKAKGSIDAVKKRFMTQFKTGFTQATNKGSNMMESFTSGLSRGFGSAKNMIMGLLGPQGIAILSVVAVVAAVALIAYALYKAFEVGLERFKEIEAAAKSFREETGLLNSQTRTLQGNIQAVSTEFAGLGASAEDVGKSATAFTQTFGGLEQPSREVLGSMVMLNKNFGVGVEQGAELNKVFQNMGGLTAAQSQALIGQTAEMAKMAGVAPSKVIADMAESSEYAYRYFNGSPKELAKAAVQAAKLGTSIKEAGAVADNLLDFESSITSELEASAILGTNLNLSQARYLAANGQAVLAQQEVLNQVSSLGDLTKLNKFEQEALTKATGMQMGDLIRQQKIKEQFGNLNEEQLASAMSLMDSGRDITSLSKEDLALQTQRLSSQKDMQGVMDNLANSSSALKTGFSDMFEPIAAFVMPVLNDLFTILNAVLLPIFRVIGLAFKMVFKPLKAVYDVISAIVMPLVAIGSAITNALLTPFEAAFDALEPLFLKIGEFKEVMMKFAQPIIGVISSIGKIFGSLVGGAIGFFVDFLVKGFGLIYDVISFIGESINKYIVQPIMTAVNAIGSAFSSMGSFLGISDEAKTDGSTATTDSINDGIVQNGKVISTHPADTLIATKNPSGLVNSVNSAVATKPPDGLSTSVNPAEDGIGGLLNGVGDVMGRVAGSFNGSNRIIEKLDELIVAVGGSRDVYMDREKVSSAVVKTNEKSGENRFGLMGA
jgi:hypothetical protein